MEPTTAKTNGTSPQHEPETGRALSVLERNIPADLKAIPQWLVWKHTKMTDEDTGETYFTKPPLNASGGPGSSTNPRTWSTFEAALAAMKNQQLSGIGFVLRAKPEELVRIVGIDLDHCRDPQTGAIAEWATKFINRIASYTEVSPSGCGVRIFLRGKLPSFGRKKGNYENYENGRYVTVTGHHVIGTSSTIEYRQAELDEVHKAIFGEATKPNQHQSTNGVQTFIDLDDGEIIRKAFKAKNGSKFKALWEGDTSGYPSASEADLSLCNHLAFWCRGNADRVDVLFRQSGLNRLKWNRDDYRERTLRQATEGRTTFYEPRHLIMRQTNERHSLDQHDSGKGDNPEGGPPGETGGAATQPGQEDDGEGIHLTDVGNGQRLIKRHGSDLRFCHPWRRWLVWVLSHWTEDNRGEVTRRAKETIADLFAWAGGKIQQLGQALQELDPDSDEAANLKKQLAKLIQILNWCLKSESKERIKGMIEMAQSEDGIPILPEHLDRDQFLFNCTNGTIDLRTGKLHKHNPKDFITKLAQVNYDPGAECSIWKNCLNRWMDGNQDMADYLQRVFGYALSGDVREQCLWFFHGAGANAKSTCLTVLRDLFGDYGLQAVSELLMQKNNESHPTERADLFGKRFVCTVEIDEGKRIAEAFMKQLTGGEKVQGRKMRQDFFEMDQTWKIFMVANHEPVIRGTDHAAWRRIKLVPFTVTIHEEERDKGLPAKLKAEMPGILAWMVQGCLAWQRNGMGEPDEVRQATAAYEAESDTVREFISTCCFVNPNTKIQASVLLDRFQNYSGDKWMTQKAFTVRMGTLGFPSESGHANEKYYKGLGLPADEETLRTG